MGTHTRRASATEDTEVSEGGLCDLCGSRFLSGACAIALAAAIAAPGCGPGARIGPSRGFVSSVEDLALSVDERMRPIETLYDPDVELGYSIFSARARLFLSGRRRFRVDVSHSLAPKLGKAVLNEDGFLLVNWADKKAFTGDVKVLLELKLPDVGLGPDYFIVRKLFFPDLEPVSGERPVLVYGENTYAVEFWTQGRLWPVRAVTVDDWSHAPTRAVFYAEGGRVGADVRWDDFVYLHDYDCVVAKEVVVRLPLVGRTVRFTLNEPRYNAKIDDRAYRLRVPPGVEVEEIKAEGPEQ